MFRSNSSQTVMVALMEWTIQARHAACHGNLKVAKMVTKIPDNRAPVVTAKQGPPSGGGPNGLTNPARGRRPDAGEVL